MPRPRRTEDASPTPSTPAPPPTAPPGESLSGATVVDPPLAGSRAASLGVAVLLVGTFVTALGGAGAGAAIAGWLTDGAVLVAWILAAWAIGATLVRRDGQSSDADRTLRHVSAIALGLGAISLAVMLLGWAGALSRPVAWLILLGGAAAALVRLRARAADLNAWLTAPAGAAWLALLVTPAVGVAAVAARVVPGFLWGDEPSGYDVVSYHLQLPREWFELGHVVPLRNNVFSFFPLAVEMHALLAMHLRGGAYTGMYLAQAMCGAFALLVPLACYATVRAHAGSRLAGAVAAIVALAAPWTAMLGGIAYNEGGLMLYATLAAGWALRGRWALAGAMAGLAAGCKYTGVTSAILLVPVVALFCGTGFQPVSSLQQRHGLKTRATGVAIFFLTALLVFSPWLVRNAVYAGGNPVFPLALRTLGHAHFDPGQVERFEVAHAPRADQRSIGARLDALWQQVGRDWRYAAVGPVPTLFLLALVAAALRPRDRGSLAWLLLIAGNAIVWLVATHLQGRFLVQAIPCAAIAATLAPRFGRPQLAIVALVALIASAAAYREPIARLTRPNTLAPVAVNATIGIEGPEDLRELWHDDVRRAIDDAARPIVMVGDIQPFRLPVATRRLHYRTVFDVPSAGSFADAWLGAGVPDDAAAIVTPGELERFGRTYRNLPAVPPRLRGVGGSFVVRAGELRRE